ncbi:MAG: AAA family ATPase [Porticoccaceae bacterium]|nr:AAA family ATPase [Porticoccaceae bacterium]
MQDARDLGVIISAQASLIVVETHDEKAALELLQRVACDQQKPLLRWTVTDGLRASHFGLQLEQDGELTEPEQVLRHIRDRAHPGIYMLCDFHPWIEDQPKNVRLLKDIALKHDQGAVTLVLVSHQLNLPPELVRLAAKFSLSLASEGEILAMVKDEARKWAVKNQGNKVRADGATINRLARALRGLSHGEVRRLVKTAIYDDGAITDSDIPEINTAKFRLMDMEAVLTYSYEVEDFNHIGGMENLKNWLSLRKDAFFNVGTKIKMDTPKGVLLLGVQGGGKSLAAKAVAGLWGLPMLRLDVGALYNKFYGETERNLREALQLADQMSPCVLWLDEIEKAISSGDNDAGVSQRVLGTLLTWMQERKTSVFMVATANDISRLPAELLRKGRFDEIFFVDLPSAEVRREIFAIHLGKRDCDTSHFDLDALAAASEGFSGAEIEQAVVAALYSGLATSAGAPDAKNMPLTTESIVAEVMATAPLSAVMAEKLHGLRNWAAERNVRTV